MAEVVGVLCHDVLLECVALGKTLVAVDAGEVSTPVVDRLHVLLQACGLLLEIKLLIIF